MDGEDEQLEADHQAMRAAKSQSCLVDLNRSDQIRPSGLPPGMSDWTLKLTEEWCRACAIPAQAELLTLSPSVAQPRLEGVDAGPV